MLFRQAIEKVLSRLCCAVRTGFFRSGSESGSKISAWLPRIVTRHSDVFARIFYRGRRTASAITARRELTKRIEQIRIIQRALRKMNTLAAYIDLPVAKTLAANSFNQAFHLSSKLQV